MGKTLLPAIANAQSPVHRASVDLKGSIGYAAFFDDDSTHLHIHPSSAKVRADALAGSAEVRLD